MKFILFGVLGLLFSVTSCSGMFGLSTDDTDLSPVYSDTIQYIMTYDSSLSGTDTIDLYAWENRAAGSIGLDTLYEGYRTIEHLLVKHIPKDRSSFKIIDTPDFLSSIRNSCYTPSEGLIYHKPGSLYAESNVICAVYQQKTAMKTNTVVAESAVDSGGGSMSMWTLQPIQEHAGKTYTWGVAVTNHVGAGDTLWIETYVTPFDSTIWAIDTSFEELEIFDG